MPLLVAEQLTEEWFAAHRGRITASNAAACLGLCEYTSRQKAYRIAMGTEPHRDNPAMAWGRQHEAQARHAYESLTGDFVTPTGFWVHPLADWLGASPDGLVGAEGLLELKCPGVLPTKMPVHHLIQCQVQMMCTRRRWCDYLAWHPEGTFLARVEARGHKGLLNRLNWFYCNYVDRAVEPERKRRKKCRSTMEEKLSPAVNATE